jgi:hypothetical protein
MDYYLACPICGDDSELLPTSSEWKHYCNNCCVRFNDDNEIWDLESSVHEIYDDEPGDPT